MTILRTPAPETSVFGVFRRQGGENNFSRCPRNALKSLSEESRIKEIEPHNRVFAAKRRRPKKIQISRRQELTLHIVHGLALSARERLGEEKSALAQALIVDPMADPKREMPLGRDRGSGEGFRRHEHRVKRDQSVLIAVNEQDRRRRAARIARRRFARAARDPPTGRKSQESPRAPAGGEGRHAAPSCNPG